MIKYRIGYDIDYIRLIEMFCEAGWDDRAQDFKRLVGMVENSDFVITAWDFDYMVGFARVICNEAFQGQISNLVVDSEYSGKGIEKELINHILLHNPRITHLITADKENEDFYKSLGFEPVNALIYRPKNA